MVLLHELIHIKRFDPFVLRLTAILTLIHWFNPAAWFFKGKERAMIKTIFEEKYDAGITDGEIKAGRNLVLKALRAKFGKVPKGIEKTVLSMTDPIALESLLEHVIHCNTLDEFATML